MSHEVETMAWTNEVPWHGLGVEVKGNITSDEWLKKAGLDWEIQRRKIFFEAEEGKYHRIPNRYVHVRDKDNKPMTFTGHVWKDWTNREMIAFIDEYARATALTIETAGSLRGGQLVWALARLKKDFSVTSRDKLKGYLLLTTSHIVGTANTARSTSVRVVCANTMAAAEHEGTIAYSQNHSRAFDVAKAREQVEKAHDELAAASRRWTALRKIRLNAEDYLNKVLAPVLLKTDDEEGLEALSSPENQPKRIQQILSAFENAPGAEPENGWGGLNAFTYWADHMAGRLPATRLNNSWYGTISRDKGKIEKAIMELA